MYDNIRIYQVILVRLAYPFASHLCIYFLQSVPASQFNISRERSYIGAISKPLSIQPNETTVSPTNENIATIFWSGDKSISLAKFDGNGGIRSIVLTNNVATKMPENGRQSPISQGKPERHQMKDVV